MMKQEDLTYLRELLEAATPGLVKKSGHTQIRTDDGRFIAEFGPENVNGAEKDCELFTALRNHAESLISDGEAVGAMREALKPFAKMHREGGDPKEIASVRGGASDRTMIDSGDFALAFDTLARFPEHE